jgi:hypothetical protein
MPMPPITNEEEAIDSVVYHYPETRIYLANPGNIITDAGITWDILLDKNTPSTRPSHMMFEVNKYTGYVKRIPLR